MWNKPKLQYTVIFSIILFIISDMRISGESKQLKDKNLLEQRVPTGMKAYWYVLTPIGRGNFYGELFDFCSYPYKIRKKGIKTVDYNDFQIEEEKVLSLEIRKVKDKYNYTYGDWTIYYTYLDESYIPPEVNSGYLTFDVKKRKLFIPKGVSEEINYKRAECGAKDFGW
jgi:hypothetical protein